MVRIQCDNCEQPFEVDTTDEHGKVACPHCGDINRVPVARQPIPIGASGAESGSVAAAAPAAARPEEAKPVEHDLAVIHPAMFRAHPFRYSLLVLIALGGLTLAIWTKSAAWNVAYAWGGLAMLAFAIGWWLYWYVSSSVWVKVRITNKRTIRQVGIVRRHTTEVLHDHVRSVDIRQTFFERLFGVGTVGIDSAGQDEIEIVVDDIPKPFKVKEMIDRHRKM